MKTLFTTAIAVGVLAVSASAGTVSESYGWEDGTGTILGSFGNIGSATNITSPVNSGQRALGLTEDPQSGTPQAYVAWITGLSDGDTIDASFWGEATDSTGNGIRIWGHYGLEANGVLSFEGSAGGNNTYVGTSGYEQVSNQWVFDSSGGTRDSLIIEVRLYSGTGQDGPINYFVDDLYVEVNGADVSGVRIYTPGNIPAPGALALLGMAGLASRRRRRT